jgi:signal transduction histidine kinase
MASMTLPLRAATAGLALAVPVAAAAVVALNRTRDADLELALARVVRSQVNDQVRERCESDPRWFLTGSLAGRPRGGDAAVVVDPDGLPPRPKVTEQQFELFAYDEDFIGSSPATPRFPVELRNRLRAAADEVGADYDTPAGTGKQMAVATGWIGGPCAYFLGRMAPPPDQASLRQSTAMAAFAIGLVVTLAAAAPLVLRIRRLARLARQAKDGGYTTLALDQRQDELNEVTFVYNDAANELRLRKSRIADLETALRRFVQSLDDEVAAPIGAIERAMASGGEAAQGALRQAHDLAERVGNLAAAARLRLSAGAGTPAPVDMNAIVATVVGRLREVARAAGVTIVADLPGEAVIASAERALVERAVANVVDNAVRYNQPGGRVAVTLAREADGKRFRLTVTDNGRGVTAEEFKGLTAIRRFRGDEHRNRRPGAPGLGLAVAREVADRAGFELALKRPGAGGFEVEFAGPVVPSGSQA